MKSKHLLLMLLLTLFVPWAAMAQTPSVTIGSGTATSPYVPGYNYYNYAISQQIYTAEEINASGNITSISFYKDGTDNSNGSRKFDIYMAHTTKTGFEGSTSTTKDWIALTDADIVFHGTTNYSFTNNAWNTITLETPFNYNGTDNLVICVIDRTGNCSSSSSYANKYRVFSTGTAYQAIYKYTDDYPNITPDGYQSTTSTSQLDYSRLNSKNQIILGGIQQTCAKPTDLAATLDDTDHTIATLSWTENGESDSWVLQVATNNTFTEGLSTYEVSGTPTKNLQSLTAEQTYYARVKPSCDTEGNKWSNTVSFTPTAAITATIYQNATDHCDYVPVYGYYADSKQQSEFIIPASQLSGLADGTIKAMTFYAGYNFNSTASFQVYLKEVEDETISQSTFYGTEGATTVYTGKVSISSTNGMTITFTNNYAYNGGNLLVGFYLPSGGNCSSSGDYFIGKTVNGASHSSTYGNNPTQRNFIPTTTFLYLPSPTPKPLNLHVVDGSLWSGGATLAWEAPSSATPTSYEYRYKTDASAWSAWESTTELSVALNLSSSTHYTFQVKAIYDGVGESAAVETDFTTLDACAFPTNLVATTTPGQGTKATLTWVKGYDEEAWVLEYATNADFTEGLVEVTDGFTVEGNNVTANLTGLTAETHYYARVKANCDGPTSSPSNVVDFTTTNYVDYTFNENATSNSSSSYIPFRGNYVAYQTNSQFIIPQTSLGDLAGGTVKKLTFYSTSDYADVAWGNASFKVYVAEVDNTTFASNPTSLDWSAMEEVYSGSLSVVNSQMVIELDQEFTYSGTKNLMIGFEKTAAGTNATVAWIYKSASNTCAYSYNSSSATGTLYYGRSGYLPKMTFNYRPTATPRPIITVPVTTTDVTATIAWTKPSDNVTGYKYQYKLATTTEWPTSWTELNDANAVSVTVPNLTPNTSYDFQIKAVYAEGESVASSTSFATTCPAATAVPYTYGFETAPEFNCWEVAAGSVSRYNGYAHANSYCLLFWGSQLNEIEMPLFNQPTNTLRLEYWVRPEGYTDSRCGSFAIGYYNANNEFVALKTYEFNTTTNKYDGWESTVYIKQSIDFDVDADNDGTPDVPDNANIVLRQFNTTSNYYWMVDDVKVKVIPTCADVNDVHYVSFTNHSATIAWTAEAAQAAWQIAYKAGANFDPYNAEELATATVVDVTSNPYLFDKNLEAATKYYMYVRGNCGGSDLGDWSDSYATFTTKTATPAPSNFTASNFGSRTVDLVWTAGGGDYETSWELYYVASATAPTAPDDDTDATKTVNTLPTTEAPYQLTGLDPESRYYIWVRANHTINSVTTHSAWVALTGNYFTTDVACPAPTNVAASNITNNSAEISWEGDANGYNVQYREYAAPTETLYDFENGMGEWTTIDADNDGFNWVLGSQAEVYLYEGNLSGNGYNGSSDLIASGSYRNTSTEGGEALNPDNYLVSPMITLGGTISFYACGTDDDYYAEHFGVFVSTNSNDNPDDFVMVNEWTATSTSYTQYSADLSAYSGKGYVAIRHFDCSDQFVLRVDNITITDPVTEQPWTLIEDVTSPQPIPGLTAETTYEVQVQAVCGGEDGESVWTSLAEPFTTLSNCSAPGELNVTDITGTSATLSWTGAQDKYNVRYSKLVFGPEVTTTEDFSEQTPAEYSSTGELPEGWKSYTTQSYTPHVSNNSSYSYISNLDGNYLLMTTNNSNTASVYAIMPKYDNLTAVSFNYAFESTSYYCGTLEVGYVTDNSGYSTFVRLGDAIQPAAGWNSNPYTLSSSDINTINANGGYVAFKYNSNSSSYYSAAIDNVIITTQSSTQEAWNEDNVNVNSPLPIDNLEMGASYAWQVQGINTSCGENGVTDWSETATFTTPFTKTINAYDTDNEKGWYLIASPLTDAVDLDDVDGLTNETFRLYSFNQGADLEWQYYAGDSNPFTSLVNGKGYLYANTTGDDLTFTGVPYSGTGEVPVTYTAGAEFAGWNLIGNPFGTDAYLVDANNQGLAYIRMNSAGNGFDEVANNAAIAPMEGIFYQATAAGMVYFSTTAPGANSGNLNMTVSQGRGTKDNAIIRFGEGNIMEKFSFREGSTKVYIPQYGKDYAVVNAEAAGEMPVNFKAEENGTYSLSFNAEGVSFSYLHLIDNMTGNDIDLLQTPSYTFNATTTDYESRFKLVFCTGVNDNSDSFAFCSNGNWIISNEGEATLQVIDVNGRILSSETVNGSVSKSINAAPGVYMIRLINGENVKVQKVVIE